MSSKLDTQGTRIDRGWQDREGFVGPIEPGIGPRKNPRGDFPTGPAVGAGMPDVRCQTADETSFDLHGHRAGRPAVFVFHRSAVW